MKKINLILRCGAPIYDDEVCIDDINKVPKELYKKWGNLISTYPQSRIVVTLDYGAPYFYGKGIGYWKLKDGTSDYIPIICNAVLGELEDMHIKNIESIRKVNELKNRKAH